MLTQTIPIVGQAVRIEGNMLITSSGDRRDSYNLRYYRLTEPCTRLRRRLPPINREWTCENLLQLILMTKSFRAKMVFEKQYGVMALRHLERR